MNINDFRFDGSKPFKVNEFNTKQEGNFKKRSEAEDLRDNHINDLQGLQEKLYAEGKEGVLIIFQAMDAAGKDGSVKYVMSGVNPAGVSVHNFKVPSSEELAHDYLWRAMKVAPQRGMITIFNRSYYEDVLVVKVHNLHKKTSLPERVLTDDIFNDRYEQIKNYEKHLHENGFRIIKIFLNISKQEQKKQFLQRIDDPSKNWKFSDGDIVERGYWDKYMHAYEDAINATATKDCPWYVVPSDKKWFARALIAEIVVSTLESINPQYPEVSEERKLKLKEFRDILMSEE
ncbi:MAG: polyphosphate kinase 2 family protein [Erysipelotrichia bacterium]|jgi:PPK2 family polyphosphate:nucleotide phosphotransferase|nr:polyphosphate kinase 2 family protein [Erysipelotrichia bacterium]